MSLADARALLRAKLLESLAPNDIELFTAQGKTAFNFSLATDNLTNILFAFFEKNQRMPTVIFNDGVPKAFDSLRPTGAAFQQLISWYTFWTAYGGPQNENQTVAETVVGSPHFNVKVQINPPFKLVTEEAYGETGATIQKEFIVTGPQNTKPQGVPWDNVEFGAFQTWGVLVVAVTHPQYLFATDDGIMLTREGCMVIDRSLAYWVELYLNQFQFSFLSIASMSDFYTNGPYMLGVPFVIVDKIREMVEASKKAGGTTGFFKYILQMIITFVGFYYGAAAMSGLVGGAFTIPNMTGALSMAQRFGVNTGKLSTALKIVGLTTGQVSMDTAAELSKDAPMDAEFWEQIGIDPGSISYDTLGGDISADIQDSINFNMMDDSEFWAQIGINPNSISYNLDGLDSSSVNELISGDYGNTVEAFAQAPAYDDVAIRAENDAALARQMGPMSANQYAAAAKASPSVATAAQAAMKQGGGSPNSVKATPQQAAQAQQVAKQNATQAKLNGDSTSAAVWAGAGQLLKMYGDYQLADKKIEMQLGSKLPNSTTYPAQPGSVVRQPDGSISIRNADGSISTIRPNGQTAVTPAGSALPAFLSDKKVLLAAGAGVAVIAAIVVASNSRR